MIKYQIIYWRDIPAQVRLKEGRKRSSYPLSERFQKTIHRAAYRAKAIHGDDYIVDWQPTTWQIADGAAADVAAKICGQLEADYSDQRLDALAQNKGYTPSPPPPQEIND